MSNNDDPTLDLPVEVGFAMSDDDPVKLREAALDQEFADAVSDAFGQRAPSETESVIEAPFVFDATDFHCWCLAVPGEPCRRGTSDAGDQELQMGLHHANRRRAAMDAQRAKSRRAARGA